MEFKHHLAVFNPMNKYARSSAVTSIEQHFKKLCPSVLCDQHCIVHIHHVLKVLQALRSDLFPWVTFPHQNHLTLVTCPRKQQSSVRFVTKSRMPVPQILFRDLVKLLTAALLYNQNSFSVQRFTPMNLKCSLVHYVRIALTQCFDYDDGEEYCEGW